MIFFGSTYSQNILETALLKVLSPSGSIGLHVNILNNSTGFSGYDLRTPPSYSTKCPEITHLEFHYTLSKLQVKRFLLFHLCTDCCISHNHPFALNLMQIFKDRIIELKHHRNLQSFYLSYHLQTYCPFSALLIHRCLKITAKSFLLHLPPQEVWQTCGMNLW